MFKLIQNATIALLALALLLAFGGAVFAGVAGAVARLAPVLALVVMAGGVACVAHAVFGKR